MRKLDVVGTVMEAYRGAYSHFLDLVKLVWLPVVIYIVANIAQQEFLQRRLEELQQQEQGSLINVTEAFSLPIVLLMLVGLFTWPMIAVAWHRFVLLGDRGSGAVNFHFGRREAVFLLASIFLVLLALPAFLVAMVSGALADPVSGDTALSFGLAILALVLAIAAVYYSVRLTLLLPAVAIGEPLNARAILDITKGNFWRLLGMIILNMLFIMVIAIALNVVGALVSFIPGGIVVAIGLQALGMTVFQITSVAILSIAYRDLSGMNEGAGMSGAGDIYDR
ncbi:hypothetical protein [Tepidicaulis sp.]|uniref:hypothetical protein n=1 Tax=Tepidicaulis sp. TaxID=1920809 RepID=UPI003B590779